MAIINFTIPEKLEKRVTQRIKQKGFAGKAEFFRMAAMFFLENETIDMNDTKRSEFLVQAIKSEVIKKYGDKKKGDTPPSHDGTHIAHAFWLGNFYKATAFGLGFFLCGSAFNPVQDGHSFFPHEQLSVFNTHLGVSIKPLL